MRCARCNDTGHVTLVDLHQYNTAFACICQRGEALSNAIGMALWNGAEKQQHDGREFRLLFPDILNASR